MPSGRDKPSCKIAVVLLAAGRSRRFKRGNKLSSRLNGAPLVCHALAAAAGSRARPVLVVSGHRRLELVRTLLAFTKRSRRIPRLREVFNRDFRKGMAASLRRGLAAVPDDCIGAVVCLGDMPRIKTRMIDALIDAFEPGDSAVVPVAAGRRGNPVLIARRLFPAIAGLRGDQGARKILVASSGVREIEAGRAVLLDVDTRQDLAAIRGVRLRPRA